MPEVIADVSMSDNEVTLDVVHDFDRQLHRITVEVPNDLVEKIGLETFGTDPSERLMCQCKIKKGKVTVEY